MGTSGVSTMLREGVGQLAFGPQGLPVKQEPTITFYFEPQWYATWRPPDDVPAMSFFYPSPVHATSGGPSVFRHECGCNYKPFPSSGCLISSIPGVRLNLQSIIILVFVTFWEGQHHHRNAKTEEKIPLAKIGGTAEEVTPSCTSDLSTSFPLPSWWKWVVHLELRDFAVSLSLSLSMFYKV
jgi:hypothetical protein